MRGGVVVVAAEHRRSIVAVLVVAAGVLQLVQLQNKGLLGSKQMSYMPKWDADLVANRRPMWLVLVGLHKCFVVDAQSADAWDIAEQGVGN